MDDLQPLQKEKGKENSQQIIKLIQIIDDKDQLMKDNETKFINKLKQQEKQFIDIINENLRENQNELGLKYRQDNEKLNSKVNNFKRQLKIVQKEFEDFKEGQSFMALSPRIVNTRSVDYNNSQTTSKKNNETILKNSFSLLEPWKMNKLLIHAHLLKKSLKLINPLKTHSQKIFKILKLIQEKNSNHRPPTKHTSDHKHIKTLS